MTSLTIPKDDAEVQIALGALQWGASHSQPSTSKSTKQAALGTVTFAWQRQRERTCLESISAEIRWSWVSWNFPEVAVVLLVLSLNWCCLVIVVLIVSLLFSLERSFFSAGDIASQCFTIFTPGFSAFLEDARPKKGVVTKVVIFQLTRFIGITTWCWTTLVGGSLSFLSRFFRTCKLVVLIFENSLWQKSFPLQMLVLNLQTSPDPHIRPFLQTFSF